MKRYEAKSSEDLKTLGNLKPVKLLINSDLKRLTNTNDMSTFIKISSNSCKCLYTKIETLLKICTEYSFISTSNVDIDVNHFKSTAAHRNIRKHYIFPCILESYTYTC